MKQAKFNLERRKDKEGNEITKNVPIRLSMFINGKRLEYFTGIRISNSKNFNTKYYKEGKQYIKSNEPNAGRLNQNLNNIRKAAETFYDNAIALGQTPTCESIKKQLDERFKGKSSKPEQVLVKDAFIEFLNETKEKKSIRTWKKHHTTFNHVANACGKQFETLPFDQINTAFVERVRKEMIKRGYKAGGEKKEYLNNTVVKYLRSFREFLNWCKDEKREYYSGKAKFEGLQENEINVIYLNLQEIDQVTTSVMPNKRLEEVKDVFLFGCYTGMRYSDIYNLRKKDVLEEDVRFYITKDKRTTWHYTPLLPQSKAILEKYAEIEGEKALPVISNQKFNDYLKEVMKIAEINEKLTIREVKADGRFEDIEYEKWELITCHTSRKSFITCGVQSGKSELEIKSMTGHSKNSRAFARYYEISPERKRQIVKEIFGTKTPSKLKKVS